MADSLKHPRSDLAGQLNPDGGTDALWFAAGINHEQNGLLGVLRP
jgi:hypothetical protein